MPGTRVLSEMPRARATSAMPITPTRPRYMTISPAPYRSDAYFTHTPIAANRNVAQIMSSGADIRALCPGRTGRRFVTDQRIGFSACRYHSWKWRMPSSIGLWYGPASSSPRSNKALRPASMRSAISSSSTQVSR